MQLARYGNAWIGRFSFLMQKQNAITIQNSIKTARQKALRTGANTYHEYSNDYLDSDKIANNILQKTMMLQIELEILMS